MAIGVTTLVRRDGGPTQVDIADLSDDETTAWMALQQAAGVDGWHVVARLLIKVRELTRAGAVPADDLDAMREFLGIFREYGFARLARIAHEDGHVDINAYYWERFEALVDELRLDKGESP